MGKKCFHRKRREAVHAVLAAIEKNPSLKAAVEAEAGVALPQVPPCCRDHPARRCCRLLGCIVVLVFLSFFIAISSLIIAASLISGMTSVQPDGSSSGPSGFSAFFILFLVLAAEVWVASIAIRKIKSARAAASAGNSATLFPSAPPAPTSAPAPPCRMGCFFRRIMGALSPPPAPSSQFLYQPLSVDASEHGFGGGVVANTGYGGAEMVPMRGGGGAPMVAFAPARYAPPTVMVHQQPQSYVYNGGAAYGQPVSAGQTLFVPLAASPVTGVSMI